MSLEKVFYNLEKSKKAIGHFNVSNLETFEMVVKAGRKAKVPVIIGVSEGAIAHAGIDFFIWSKEYFQKKYGSEFYLHLDHGRDTNIIVEAIKKGFDSVMIDASHKSFSENIYLTKYVVNIAHKYGVLVEAEIGRVGRAEEGISEKNIVFTDPLQAVEFVEKTKCDSLAISIGTSHGPNKFLKKSRLDFDVLQKVRHLVNIPLVLHGASSIDKNVVANLKKQGVKIGNAVGVSEEDIYKAIKYGIRKINTDTDVNLAMILGVLKNLRGNNPDLKLYKALEKAVENSEQVILEKIKLFNKR